jgi:hypothetical protein
MMNGGAAGVKAKPSFLMQLTPHHKKEAKCSTNPSSDFSQPELGNILALFSCSAWPTYVSSLPRWSEALSGWESTLTGTTPIDFQRMWHQNFEAKTNGVAPKRQLKFANPKLSGVIVKWVESDE